MFVVEINICFHQLWLKTQDLNGHKIFFYDYYITTQNCLISISKTLNL